MFPRAAIVKNAEVKALVRRVYRVLERLVIGVVVAVAVLVAVVSLRLMSGPVDLDFLKSRIAQEFDTPGGKMKVQADRVYVEWSGVSQPVRLVFSGLHVTDADKREVATAPNVALSFEARSVVSGHFLPSAIVVEQPSLDAEIAREGGMLQRIFAKTDGNSQSQVMELLVEQLLAEPNYRTILGQLDTVLVERARVTLHDIPSGIVWTAPNARASLKRDASGVIIGAEARFSRGGSDEPIDVALSGVYARDRSRISVEAKIDGLKPLMFADYAPEVAILRGVDIALSGRLNVEASGDGEVRSVRMEVNGGKGTLNLPGILTAPHAVRSVNALAFLDTEAKTATIDHVDIDLGAAKVAITGVGHKSGQTQSFSGRADVRQIPVDRLGEYWPLDLAEGGREWALANVTGGTVDVGAEFAFDAPIDDPTHVKVDRLVGFLEYRGLRIHYMPHMPEIENVSGKARYENGTLHFDVAGGTSVGLGVTGATIDLTGLDASEQAAALHLPIAGPVPAVEALLARPKLGLPKDALFDPKRLDGDAAIDLTLHFPLLASLAVADIDIRAEAALSGFALRNVLGDVDLTDAVGRVIYGNDQLTVSGQGKLDGNVVDIGWHQIYMPKAPYRQRYELKGTVPAALMAKAGFPTPEPYLTGPVGVVMSYQTQANGTSEVQAKLDLKGARATAEQLDWTKPAGTAGTLKLGVKLAAGAKVASIDFDGQGNGLVAKGQVRFGDGAAVEQVDLRKLSIGRSDIALDWKRAGNGVEVALRGRSLELLRIRQALKSRDDLAATKPDGAAAAAERSTRVSVRLDQLLVQRGALGALSGRLEMAGERLASADLALGAGKGSAFKVTPAGRSRTVALFVPDFGLLLKEAGWLDGLVGGDLNFQGSFDDSTPQSRLTGIMRLGPYHLEKVAPRADVGSLNSTIDGLGRAGNALQNFDSLEARMAKTGDRVDITNGRTSGKSIGLTTAGWIDLGNDTARLRGVVVPGFALNNLLSNVPLLGPLLTGGKDAGLFAISYKLEGPLDDLKSDINMMSAITPGGLRELFSSSGDRTPVPDTVQPTP